MYEQVKKKYSEAAQSTMFGQAHEKFDFLVSQLASLNTRTRGYSSDYSKSSKVCH